ncbi:MAG TPA: glycosyltransferase [Bacteroidales bacterium]|nr:glycosyltransferase [Bacteroidales bacterium]
MEFAEWIVFVAFAVVAVIQLAYYWMVFSRLAFAKKSLAAVRHEYPPVSVVISARNEDKNLKSFLPEILNQDYPDFEVLVVNDLSDDNTPALLEEMQKQYPHLRVFTLSQHLNFFSGKKFPLSLGIKSVKHDHLLLTDADCHPKSDQWIKSMMASYDEQTELVLGYGAYEKKKGFLNTLIRYETLKTAMQYFSYAMMGLPYMGTGRNLSYKRSLFYRVGGFTSHYRIASGDDDLFVNKVATPENTRLSYSKESHTLSQPKTSFGSWFSQKSRHVSTGKYYKPVHKYWLGTYTVTKALIYILFALAMIFIPMGIFFYISASVMGLFLISQIAVSEAAARKLDEKGIGWGAPFLELFFIILEPLWLAGNIFRKNQWK